MTPQQIKANAPEGETHYSITKKRNIRYHTKDYNDKWGVYQDWKYPIGWRAVGIFFDDSKLKPL